MIELVLSFFAVLRYEPLFSFCSMSSRIKRKVYKYCLFYFPETNEVGTAKTSAIEEGWRCGVRVGAAVKVSWGAEKEVPAKILQMDGMVVFLN